MPFPPPMWLKDGSGEDIRGPVDIQDREGSIEIIGMSHGINLPVDGSNGRIIVIRKALCIW